MAPPGLAVWFLRILIGFVRRELVEMSRYRVAFLVRFVTFGLGVVSLYFFSRFIGSAHNRHLEPYGGNYLAFGMVGLLAAELQQVGVSALSQRVRVAQMMGYLEAQLATPAPNWMVLGAAPVYEFGTAALRSVVYLIGASLVLDVSFDKANLPSVAAVVPLLLLAFVGLGLLTAALSMITRRANPVAVFLGAASFFLSGVAYPVSVLPDWLRGVGQLLPLTHALEALRQALLVGTPPAALGRPLFALLLFGVGFGASGFVLFVYALRRAREDGSLTHY